MKRVNILILLSIFIVAITGCNDKKIEMNPGGISAEPTVTKGAEISPSDNDRVKINDKIKYVDEAGKSYACTIKLDYDRDEIALSDVCVISYDTLSFDPACKEKIVKAVFGDSNVYSGDDEDATIDELKELMKSYEQRYTDTFEDGRVEINMSESGKYFQERYEKCKEYLAHAPSIKEPVKDYDHVRFVGHVPGIDEEYAVVFMVDGKSNWAGRHSIYFGPAVYAIGEYDWPAIDQVEEAVDIYNETKASEIVGSFLEELGLSPCFYLRNNNKKSEFFYEGFDLLMDKNSYSIYNKPMSETFYFKNDKIVYSILENPISNITVNENVELLDFSEIHDILLDIINSKATDYFTPNNAGNITIDRMRFEHIVYEKDGRHYFAPAWVIGEQLAINAIDGSYTRYVPKWDLY